MNAEPIDVASDEQTMPTSAKTLYVAGAKNYTGYNAAFVISQATKNQLCDVGSASLIEPHDKYPGLFYIFIPSGYTDCFAEGSDADLESWFRIVHPAVYDWLHQFKSALVKRTNCCYWWEWSKPPVQ